MQTTLTMPDLATTDADIKVVRWLVDIGATVARGQPLLEVETDKAAMEVESYVAGTLSEILAQPGDTVEVGQAIARLEGPAGAPETERAAAPAAPAAPTAAVPATPAAPAAPRKGGLFARNRQAAGGPPAAAAAAPSSASQGTLSLSLAARTAARRLQESKQTVPHIYLQMSANAEPLLARRAAAAPAKLVWDAFFVSAVRRALAAFPKLTYRFENEQLTAQDTDSIGVAVDVDGDLYVVGVAAACTSLEQISAAIRAAADGLRRNDSGARQRTRNLMTISNLGMTGVEAFAAIVNPPEAAILAVGKVGPAVIALDGRAVVQNRVTLTLSVDHRVVSGKYAAEFLQRIVSELESLSPG